MANERLAPDSLISSSGFGSCTLSDLISAPDPGATPGDANWSVASGNNTNTRGHVSLPSPSGKPNLGWSKAVGVACVNSPRCMPQ